MLQRYQVSRGRKCEPGCTCGRHQHIVIGKKCEPGCLCKKHSPEVIAKVAAKLRAKTVNPDYLTRHKRLYRARGKARNYGCVLCAVLYGVAPQALFWSQIYGTDGLNPFTDYIPLCGRCHVHLDEGLDARIIRGAKLSILLKGKPKSAEHRAKVGRKCAPGCTCGRHRPRR